MIKKIVSALLVLCMALSLLPLGALAADFTDLEPGAYYLEAVDWAVKHDPVIAKGTTGTTFSPEKTCTRGEVVTFLWRTFGAEKMFITNPFVDVPTTEYYYNSAVWAFREGITNGTDETHFSPGNPCTREQVATFLWRAMGKPSAGVTKSPFTDVTDKTSFSYAAILWAFENGVTNGTSETTFSPAAPCTRAQIVTFLYRTFHVEHSVLVRETIQNPDGTETGYIFEYDKNALNTRVTSLDGKQWEKHLFDAKGNYIKRETAAGTFDPISEEQKAEVETERDTLGRVVKETYHFEEIDDYVIKYEYDGDSDRVIATRDGNNQLTSRMTYDRNGNQTKRETFEAKDQIHPKSVETFEYDAKDQVIHTYFEAYYSASTYWDDTKYEYDDKGNVVKQTSLSSEDVNEVLTMKYAFDQKGRIISVEKTATDLNTNEKTVTTDEYRMIVPAANLAMSGRAIFPWDF